VNDLKRIRLWLTPAQLIETHQHESTRRAHVLMHYVLRLPASIPITYTIAAVLN
jgi:hypothetical protein